jgi:TonB-dependent starch-binding outer membrane protein SusC
MKKLRLIAFSPGKAEIKKWLIVMKLIICLTLIGAFQVQALVHSQGSNFTLNESGVNVREVIKQLENKSNFRFFFSENLAHLEKQVDINVTNANLEQVLDHLFKDSPLMYKVLENDLVIIMPFMEGLEQGTRISGNVTDPDGIPLPGVNIVEVGTNNGAVTDLDGNYSITVSSEDAVLRFSFVGYLTEEIVVGGQTSIDVMLMEDIQALDEVVVVGFGSRAKKDLTGSISSIQAEDLEKSKSLSPQYALQGNTSGVRIVNSSGDPNESPDIFIRGIGTWNGDAQPLYVIDGQIIEPPRSGNLDVITGFSMSTPPNLFNLINPSDIESISVLKDASAAAIYGNRGANGVILITTKKGKQGKPVLEFNSSFSTRNIPTYDMLNTQQYVDLTTEMFTNNLNPDITIEDELYGGDQDSDINRLTNRSPQFNSASPFYISDRTTYDWQDDMVVSNALAQTYDMKVSGASNGVDYYLSGSYLDQENFFKGNNLTRYTAALNVNSKINDWIKVGINYKYTYQLSDMSFRSRDLNEVASVAPWQPIYNPGNEYGYQTVIDPFYGGSESWQQAKLYGQGTSTNYLAEANINYGDFAISRNIGQAYFELTPVKGLTLRGSVNLDYAKQDRTEFTNPPNANLFRTNSNDPTQAAPDAPGSLGRISHRINNIFNYQSDFTATYANTFAGKHNLNLTAAVQDQRHETEFTDFSGSNLTTLTDNPKRNGYGNDLANNNSIYGWTQRYWFGMVGRGSYNYDRKYYADLSFRRDASIGFDDDYRWGNFYSLSGAWRISSESFMDGLTFIDDLKLRGGWGQAGNDQAVVGSYAYLSGVNTSISSVRFGSGNGDPLGTMVLGSVVADLPNPQLTWEVVSTTYVGMDAIILANRLNFTLELYNRVTDGILMSVVLPTSAGLNNPSDNVGQLENKGIDMQLGWNDRIGEFTYGVSGNISFIKNEVTKVYEGRPLESSGFGRVEEGRSLGLLWGYQHGGIFQSQEEIDAYYNATPDDNVGNTDFVAPGDMYFRDVQGNPTDEEQFYSKTPDGQINSYDRTEIGRTIPGHTYGLNLNLGWKGFDLFAGFYGEGDVEKYNDARARFESMAGEGPNYFATTLNRWTPQNTNTEMPRAVKGDPAGNNRFSSRYVEDASFLRLNNWQFGYTIPSSVSNKLKMSLLRVYVGGQNNIYLTKWSTLDPVNDNYPLARTLTFGVNAKF